MIQIRRADPNEADVLTQIAFAAKRHWGYPEHWMEIWAPQLTFSSDYFKENESWVAMDEEGPVAFYTVLAHDGIAWLDNLFVLPEFMGLGIGKQLFRHAVEIARGRSYTKLQLEADPNAIGFYERMGMYKIGERHSEVDGQPRVLPIMEMKLSLNN